MVELDQNIQVWLLCNVICASPMESDRRSLCSAFDDTLRAKYHSALSAIALA